MTSTGRVVLIVAVTMSACSGPDEVVPIDAPPAVDAAAIDAAAIDAPLLVDAPVDSRFDADPTMTEAYLQLDRLRALAIDYHQTHGHFPTDAEAITPPAACCTFAGAVCPADPTAWQGPGWSAFPFAIATTHQFTYQYAPSDAGASMQAIARGDLDCDSIESTYVLTCQTLVGVPECVIVSPSVLD